MTYDEWITLNNTPAQVKVSASGFLSERHPLDMLQRAPVHRLQTDSWRCWLRCALHPPLAVEDLEINLLGGESLYLSAQNLRSRLGDLERTCNLRRYPVTPFVKPEIQMEEFGVFEDRHDFILKYPEHTQVGVFPGSRQIILGHANTYSLFISESDTAIINRTGALELELRTLNEGPHPLLALEVSHPKRWSIEVLNEEHQARWVEFRLRETARSLNSYLYPHNLGSAIRAPNNIIKVDNGV